MTKNIQDLYNDLINVTLKAGQCIGKRKKYYLVLKVAVSSSENYYPFIALFYSSPIVNTCEIELGELFGYLTNLKTC